MSFHTFAWCVRFFFLTSLIGWVSLVLLVDPEGKWWAPWLFFGSSWLVLSGAASWLFLILYRRFIGEASVIGFRWRLIEQSVLVGSTLVIMMFFRYSHMLEWWTVGLGLAFFLLLELTLRKWHAVS